jgi:diketogulonate reductase-like aldo/keto reductase
MDTTEKIQVDEEVGLAIKESGIPRSEIFITSKFWPHFSAPENVEICLDQVLKNMGLEYVDLFLAHWPVAFKPISQEALHKAVTGPNTSDAEKGILVEGGETIKDWEYTSTNLASQEGMC